MIVEIYSGYEIHVEQTKNPLVVMIYAIDSETQLKTKPKVIERFELLQEVKKLIALIDSGEIGNEMASRLSKFKIGPNNVGGIEKD